jgi:hypothetical protein
MRTALALAFSLVCSVAAADPKPAAPAPAPTPAPMSTPMSTDDCATARAAHRQCVLDLKPEDVEGGKPVHQGIDASAIVWNKQGSLLHIRRDFIREIVKSADDLD